jgi:4-hydroxybenzoate polyprenyltransferase
MHHMFSRLMTTLQLTRMSVAFGAVSDLWFMIVLAWLIQEVSGPAVVGMWWTGKSVGILAAVLVAGAVTALGLFGCGAALNDVIDARHDAAFSPERPIPAGRIRQGQAVVIAVIALVVAVVGGAVLGPWSAWLTVFTASLLLFYNTAGRFVPAVGIVTIGIIHAVHMLIPFPETPLLLPVWWMLTHAMLVTTGVHLLEAKRPRISGRGVLGIGLGWLFWTAMLLLLILDRGLDLWPTTQPALGLLWPGLLMIVFVVFVRWKIVRAPSARHAAEKLRRYGAMWHSLYAAGWCAALGLTWAAIWFAGLAILGLVVMTVVRELFGLSGRPLHYR